MHGLSAGPHFIAYGSDGQPAAASDPELAAQPPARSDLPVRVQERFDSLNHSPTLAIRGQDHLAASVRPAQVSTPGTVLLVLYPESSWREARWDSAQVPLILGAGALALMAAATIWIAHRLSGRVFHHLEHQVARIAKGDFHELVLDPGPARDEVNDLSRSINQMYAAQLRQMSQTIRQSERTQALAQLAAGMAHQLRNALTGGHRLSIQLHLKRCDDARTDQSMAVALRQLSFNGGSGSGQG